LVIIGAIAGRGNNSSSPSTATGTASSEVVAGPPLPGQQQAFINANIAAIPQFNSGKNEIQQEQARGRRREAIQSALNGDGRIEGWIGTVESISTTGDGNGIIKIRIHPSITVSTTNNELSNIGDNTLIEKSSPLFSILGNLSKKDTVKFSGTFIPDDRDCVQETSLTIRGSMTEPNFTFRFSGIEKQ
jgi:hypothetical protein